MNKALDKTLEIMESLNRYVERQTKEAEKENKRLLEEGTERFREIIVDKHRLLNNYTNNSKPSPSLVSRIRGIIIAIQPRKSNFYKYFYESVCALKVDLEALFRKSYQEKKELAQATRMKTYSFAIAIALLILILITIYYW